MVAHHALLGAVLAALVLLHALWIFACLARQLQSLLGTLLGKDVLTLT